MSCRLCPRTNPVQVDCFDTRLYSRLVVCPDNRRRTRSNLFSPVAHRENRPKAGPSSMLAIYLLWPCHHTNHPHWNVLPETRFVSDTTVQSASTQQDTNVDSLYDYPRVSPIRRARKVPDARPTPKPGMRSPHCQRASYPAICTRARIQVARNASGTTG
jgi:hypothetical protein